MLYFTYKPSRSQKRPNPHHQIINNWRPDPFLRLLQTLQSWAQSFRRWVGQKIEAREMQRATEAQSLQTAKRVIAEAPRQRPDEPRQSRGYRM